MKQNSKQLQTLAEQSEAVTLTTEVVQSSLAVAFERTGTKPNNLDLMVEDIQNEFKGLKNEDLIEALKRGGLGHYGRTFKLTTQEVCLWIREYLKPKPKVRIPH